MTMKPTETAQLKDYYQTLLLLLRTPSTTKNIIDEFESGTCFSNVYLMRKHKVTMVMANEILRLLEDK